MKRVAFARLIHSVAGRALAFSLVGVVNSTVGIGVIVVAGLLGVGPILANVLGYGAGLVVSFTLNSRVTFNSRVVDRSTILRFLGAFVVAFAMNLAVVKLVASVAGTHQLIGSLAGTPAYMAIFYLLCEYWVFSAPPNDRT